jgi:hypothetical protein
MARDTVAIDTPESLAISLRFIVVVRANLSRERRIPTETDVLA